MGVVGEEGVRVAREGGVERGLVHRFWWGQEDGLEGRRCEGREVEDGVESRRSSGGGLGVSDCCSPLAALLNGRGGRGKGGQLRSLKRGWACSTADCAPRRRQRKASPLSQRPTSRAQDFVGKGAKVPQSWELDHIGRFTEGDLSWGPLSWVRTQSCLIYD